MPPFCVTQFITKKLALEFTQRYILCFMEKLLTIRQVATVTGLSVHTLRYYENIGLLCSIDRNENGYRCYSSADVTWIEFLTRLKATGMSITKMLEIAELRRQGDSTLTARRILLEKHYKEVQKKTCA